MFFTFRRFVPVDVFYLLCFVPIGVFSIQRFVPFGDLPFDVLSVDVFYCRRFLLRRLSVNRQYSEYYSSMIRAAITKLNFNDTLEAKFHWW
jgi:hypothetical protein